MNTIHYGDNLADLGPRHKAASPLPLVWESCVMADQDSRPNRLDPAKCCEACGFGAGEHAPWCANASLSNWLAAAQSRARLLRYASQGPEWSGRARRSKKPG